MNLVNLPPNASFEATTECLLNTFDVCEVPLLRPAGFRMGVFAIPQTDIVDYGIRVVSFNFDTLSPDRLVYSIRRLETDILERITTLESLDGNYQATNVQQVRIDYVQDDDAMPEIRELAVEALKFQRSLR